MIRAVTLAVMLAASTIAMAATTSPADLTAWPEPTLTARPWTRWWWLGSAVDERTLTQLLEQYRDAGIGGVEICPIYGAKGAEEKYVDFLSPRWMELLAHVTKEGKRLGIGVDLTDGTGWPFGGPNVSATEASAKVVLKAYDVAAGAKLAEKLPEGTIQCVTAVSDRGERVDLTSKVSDRTLEWAAPAGKWRVYVVGLVSPIQKVKRAAPGGEGNVLDPYSVAAIDKYLARFDRAFTNFSAPVPRAHFHDSFEYYNATGTRDFFEQFKSRRGYDLREQLPALFGEGDRDTVARMKSDYRETLAVLHLAYVQRWAEWCRKHGGLARNQAHGAPANLLDVYAAADIPETETFGAVEPDWMVMHKFASSAAHVSGRNLSSCESFTWLGEHFSVPLSDVKQAADYIFLTGANHIFFHGTPYSPPDAQWPGWLFYASVNFGPNGGLFRDLPAFNGYVTRIQSVLQSGRSDNDLLLYFPVHDIWHDDNSDLLMQFGVHKQGWMTRQPFYAAGKLLSERGYTFDAVSDRLLDGAAAKDGKVALGGGAYSAIVIPDCRLMPPATLRKLADLSRGGAKVIVVGQFPRDVPGLGDLEARRAQLRDAIKDLEADIGADLQKLLEGRQIVREPMVDQGLSFVRRVREGGHDYFIANRSKQVVDGWVTLGSRSQFVVVMDPRFADRTGVAAPRQGGGGAAQVYLQLKPGESCVVRTLETVPPGGRMWEYSRPTGEPIELTGKWRVEFVEGGPEIPRSFETEKLASWTTLGDDNAKRFAGTARYVLEFDAPPGDLSHMRLDLGEVCDSATVLLNGKPLWRLFSAPFEADAGPALTSGRNRLVVEVTNLAANRIADLDRRGVQWKSFHEVNFVNKDYKSFDASNWPLRDSGLIGPVRLIPMKAFTPR